MTLFNVLQPQKLTPLNRIIIYYELLLNLKHNQEKKTIFSFCFSFPFDIIYLTELMEYKPKYKTNSDYWFEPNDYESRAYALNNAIIDTYKKLTFIQKISYKFYIKKTK